MLQRSTIQQSLSTKKHPRMERSKNVQPKRAEVTESVAAFAGAVQTMGRSALVAGQ